MGDMYRSQHMELIQMIVQNESAHAVVSKLGELGIIQFRDVRSPPASCQTCAARRARPPRVRAGAHGLHT